jgi:two-component system phosphate regulon sensor histidine kinase PhoR
MNRTWASFGLALAVLALAGLVTWPVAGAGAATAVFAAGLLIVVIAHYHHLALLRRWLREPAPEAVPQGWGVWDDVFSDLYRLLRSQRQSQSRLTATLEEFQQAGAAMPDGLVILDARDRIEWCNPRAEQHLGLDRRRDAGQQMTYLVRQPQFVEYLRSRNYGEPLTLRQTRGAEFILSVQLVPYGDRQKLVISRDITDLERVEAMRRDFVANVSHELRTPITVLAGFLETVSDSGAGGNDLLQRSLPLMVDQTRRMQRLVEDLLMLSRLESARYPLQAEPVDVPGLTHALYREALALSAGRHRVLLDSAGGTWLLGSEEELRSAFGNLVTNAIRYTPDGGEVVISWQRRGGHALFSVRDTGIGIEQQHLARIAERFYRVDRGRSRETGGTGLGLAIVKHVLSRHQARLEIASEPGRGSTFSAVFPEERILAPERREEREDGTNGTGRRAENR